MLLAALASAAPLQRAQAALLREIVYTVNTTDDDPTADCTGGRCSLRGAISRANADYPNAVTISLPPGTYTLTRAGRLENENASGDLDIVANVTLVGNTANPAGTIIQAGTDKTNGVDRVMEANPNGDTLTNLTLLGLTICNGYAIDGYAAGVGYWGSNNASADETAGIGSLRVEHCIIRDNTATVTSESGSGGGLEADAANVTITDCTFTGNTAGHGSGGGLMIASYTGVAAITNTTLTENTAQQSGGGIYCVAYSTGSTDLASCTISDNAASGEGGGSLLRVASGSLHVHSTTVSGNTAEGRGGGISLYGGTGTGATIDENSEITGNRSRGTATSTCAEGGGLYLGGKAAVTNATITNNTAGTETGGDYRGGGGIAVGSGHTTMSNCRIAGNTAAPRDSLDTGSGLHLDSENGGSVTIIDNWWGCNGGPGAAGCDTAVLGSISTTQAPLPVDSWLQLGISTASTSLNVGQTSTLTADLTHNSSGAEGFHVPDGTPITFGGTLGTVSPASTTLTSGQATSTFTADSAGTGSGTATVDNGTVASDDITISAPTPPSFTSANHATLVAGVVDSFSVTASGYPAPEITQSGALPDGVSFTDNHDGTATLGGTPDAGTADTYSLTLTAHNGIGADATQTFTLTVGEPPAITSADNTTFTVGSPGNFAVTATG